MNYLNLMDTIRGSESGDWLYSDEKGIFTLKENLDIRIQRRDSSGGRDSFNESWATSFPDGNATRVFYDIYYGASFVESFMLVSVDGGRAELPLPETSSKTIERKRYELARAVDHMGTLDDYLRILEEGRLGDGVPV